MKTLEIKVTQHDIEAGGRFMSDCCPIALAINRTMGIESVVSNYGGVYQKFGDAEKRIGRLSQEACGFIYAFDRKRTVRPSIFIVDLIETEKSEPLETLRFFAGNGGS